MANIDQFIQMATKNLNVDASTAKSATGGLLGFLEGKLPQGDFQSLLGELPGAAEVKAQAETGEPAGGGGGLMGGLTKMAGGALGGKLGAAAGLVGSLKAGGLEVTQVSGFLSQFLTFAQQNLSDGLFQKILGQAPELKNAVE